MFAAVDGNIIHVYSFTSFENLLHLKGHSGKVGWAGGRSPARSAQMFDGATSLSAGARCGVEPGRRPAGVLWVGRRRL